MRHVPLLFFNNSNPRRWWFEIGFTVPITMSQPLKHKARPAYQRVSGKRVPTSSGSHKRKEFWKHQVPEPIAGGSLVELERRLAAVGPVSGMTPDDTR